MSTRDTTTLLARGDSMDESLVEGVPAGEDHSQNAGAKRPRVVLGGDDGSLVHPVLEGGVFRLPIAGLAAAVDGLATENTLDAIGQVLTLIKAGTDNLDVDASTRASEATLAKRFSGGKSTAAALITATGDTDIKAPAAGKRLTLYWIFLSSSQDNTGEVLATVKLGTRVIYRAYLGNPGAFAHWEPEIADAIDDKLTVNLSAAANVAASFTTTEA